MSTRSDIVIAVTDGYAEKLTELLEEVGIPDQLEKTKDGKFIKTALFTSVKWYEMTDEPISELMEFLRNLEENKWGFIEVGEDNYINCEGFPYEFGLSAYTVIEGPWEKS